MDNDAGLAIQAYGGAGNDTLAVNQSGAIKQGTFVPYLDGGSGNDNISFRGTGAVAAAASSLPALIGGAGNDTITSNYVGQLAGNYIYNLSVDGGPGNDTIVDTVELTAGSTGTVGTSSGVPAVVRGGAGNDKVRVRRQAGRRLDGHGQRGGRRRAGQRPRPADHERPRGQVQRAGLHDLVIRGPSRRARERLDAAQ